MAQRLLRREPPTLQELVDERVILGQLLELAAADPVGARVADVADRHGSGIAVDERHRHRGAHPGGGRVLVRALVDTPIRLLDQLREPGLAEPVAFEIAERSLVEHGSGEP